MTRWRAKRGVGWGALAVAIALGCGGSREALKPSEARDEAAGGNEQAAAIRPERREGEKLTEHDLTHDGKADLWSYTVPGKSADGKDLDRLVRKELDLNRDGKIDITRYYDEREQIEKEALDLDFDGKLDQWNHYEKGVVARKERDLDYDSRLDLWLFYEKGKLARKERDTNGDGKVDYWEYWEGEQVDRIGEDLDGDGSVDRWTKSPGAESKE